MSSFSQFLSENKLYWILPIVIVIVIVGFIVFADQPQGVPGLDSTFDYDAY